MGFPRQEYWSGFSFPSPGDLPDPGFEPHVSYMWVLYHWATREAPPSEYLFTYMGGGVGVGGWERERHCKELADRIMGAEWSQDWPAGDPGEPTAFVPVRV